jgi:aminomethyltransferase
MKETPLTALHIQLGARMMPFAGYNMPVSYTTINEEHLNVRSKVGLFDVSHMGQFFVKGKNATALVQKVTSNDVRTLSVGQAQYSCLPNRQGGIVDDLLVYKLDDNAYMLVVNASNIQKDLDWITAANADLDVQIEDRSDSMALLALQGPLATRVLAKITDIQVDQIPYYYFATGTVAGKDNVIVSATGYTGSGGYEIYLDNQDAVRVWELLMEVGQEEGIMPIGLGARDTLRLEMGFCLYGNDITDATSPIEAGLGWITKTAVEDDFYSKDTFIKQREDGTERKLVAFTVDDRRVPRNGYEIVDEAGAVIGVVTSGTMSPSLDIPIGMGYVPKALSKKGTTIGIKIRSKILPATVVRAPFYKAPKAT